MDTLFPIWTDAIRTRLKLLLELRSILEQYQPNNFLTTPQNFFDGYIFTNMPCVLTFKSLFRTMPAQQFSDDTSKSLIWVYLHKHAFFLTLKVFLCQLITKEKNLVLFEVGESNLHLKMVLKRWFFEKFRKYWWKSRTN